MFSNLCLLPLLSGESVSVIRSSGPLGVRRGAMMSGNSEDKIRTGILKLQQRLDSLTDSPIHPPPGHIMALKVCG